MIDWDTFKSQLQSDPGRMLKSVLLLAGCLFMIWLIVVMQSNPGMQQNVQIRDSGRLDSLGLAEVQWGNRPGDAKIQSKTGDSLYIRKRRSGDSLKTAKLQAQSADSLGIAERQSRGSQTFSMNNKSAPSNDVSKAVLSNRTNKGPGEVLSARDNGLSGIFPTVLIFLVLIGGAWYWLRTQTKSGKSKGAGQIFTTIASQHLPGGTQLTVVKLNGEYWVVALGGPQGTQLLHRYTSDEWQGIEGIEKEKEKKDWKKTFLKTLNASVSSSAASSQKAKTG